MKGSAPNSPATGSQVVVVRNLNPNLSREGPELAHSSQTNRAVMARIAAPQMKTRAKTKPSPLRARLRKEARPFGRAACVIVAELAIYLILAIAFTSLATTSLGS